MRPTFSSEVHYDKAIFQQRSDLVTIYIGMHATVYAEQSIWTVFFTLRFCDFSCDTGKEASWQSAKLPQGLKTTRPYSFFWWHHISLFFLTFGSLVYNLKLVRNMQFQVGILIFNAISGKVFEILRIFNLWIPCGNKTWSTTSTRRLLNMRKGSHQKVKDNTCDYKPGSILASCVETKGEL